VKFVSPNQNSKIENPKFPMSLQTEFPERLLTLCTGQSGLRGGLKVDVREPSASEIGFPRPSDGRGAREGSSTSDPSIRQSSNPPILDFVASDETLDRYDEVISVSGWKLDNYRRNPVFQNAHQYGDIIFTLGKALITELRHVGSSAPLSPSDGERAGVRDQSPVLFQRVLFATDINPMARIAYGLYKGKFLNAVSVGFIPIRWEDGSSSSPEAHRQMRRRYLEQELLEVSAVGIPANPDALQLGLKAGAIEKSDLRDTLDLLREIVASPVEVAAPSPSIPTLLALARELRRVLKN
jgi:hypothetical protein